jgi:ferredoxin
MPLDREQVVLDLAGLGALVAHLVELGYKVVGPTVRDGAIVLAELQDADQLPRGVRDVQAPGRYRLEARGDDARFGHVAGPRSFKQELYPPVLTLLHARRNGNGGFHVERDEPADTRPLALFGARACDVAAIRIQDRVLAEGAHPDDDYSRRRRSALVIAVNCGESGSSCFCISMDAGPRVEDGHDLALTELIDADGHRFLVEVGSERGAEVLAAVASRAATTADEAAAAAAQANAVATQTRSLPDAAGAREALLAALDHPRYDEVADRCLACGNCTSVCPTCFCVGVEDHTDLTGADATRLRVWDSCFTPSHSYLHGGGVRRTTRARYRQWITHKLATWHDQFGTSGCVGCGRCITWCPVGIDITEEVAAIRLPPPKEVAP